MCMTCHGSQPGRFRPARSTHSSRARCDSPMETNTTNGHKLIAKILRFSFAVGQLSIQVLSVPLLGLHHPLTSMFHWHAFFPFFPFSLWNVCEILPPDHSFLRMFCRTIQMPGAPSRTTRTNARLHHATRQVVALCQYPWLQVVLTDTDLEVIRRIRQRRKWEGYSTASRTPGLVFADICRLEDEFGTCTG